MPLLPFSDASPPTTNASLLTSGTLADARLSANVPLIASANSFTAGQTITAAANTSALTATYSVTGANTTPLVSLTGTWNTTGVARGILLNITNTASGTGSLLADFQLGGVSKFQARADGYFYSSQRFTTVGGYFISANPDGSTSTALFDVTRLQLSSSHSFSFNADTYLYRDGAANTLALRNGGTAGLPAPQNFRIYNYTDSGLTNYERAFFRWNSNTLEIGTEAGGTGSTQKPIQLCPSSSGNIWTTRLFAPSTTAGSASTLDFVISTTNSAAAIGQIYAMRVDSVTADLGIRARLIAIGPSGAGGIQSNAYPALKRSSTTLQVRLADDSAFAPVQGKLTTDNAYTAGTVVLTGYITLYDSTGTAYRVPCAV